MADIRAANMVVHGWRGFQRCKHSRQVEDLGHVH
jgi:hypothetical protein